MSRRPLLVVVAALALTAAVGPAPASAAADGSVSCSTATAAQFRELGELAMQQMVGSRAAHEAMDARMARAIGAENSARMHELMGRSVAGCAAGAPMMGGGASWNWMHDGAWRHMSQGDWRSLGRSMMGARYVSGHPGPGLVVLGVLAAIVLVLLAALAVSRPWRRPPPMRPTSGTPVG